MQDQNTASLRADINVSAYRTVDGCTVYRKLSNCNRHPPKDRFSQDILHASHQSLVPSLQKDATQRLTGLTG